MLSAPRSPKSSRPRKSATLTPLALAHHSALLAYLATFAAYGALGFSVTCRGLCWCIGFRSDRAVERVGATSTLLLAAHLVLREARGREALGPFDSPLSVVGALTLYLALLIVSSLYYERGRHGMKGRYAALNLATSAALFLFLAHTLNSRNFSVSAGGVASHTIW